MALAIPVSGFSSSDSRESSRGSSVLNRLSEKFLTPIDLNLAPFRYSRVHKSEGGPIDHLDRWEMQLPEGKVFNVNAYLDPSLKPEVEPKQVWGDADGGGTHLAELIARFIAISEAIERWAYWDRKESSMRSLYGFDIDSSGTGMAAFPGLLQVRARKKARLEALERYGLLNWWEGRLPHRKISHPGFSSNIIQIMVPGSSDYVVVVYSDDAETGTRSYGHAAGSTLAAAVGGAKTEMIRHREVTRRFIERNPDPRLALSTLSSWQARRSIFFALSEGKDLFDERLKCGSWANTRGPKTVFDGWIPGAWDRYATVWRCVFEPPSEEYTANRTDYFFW